MADNLLVQITKAGKEAAFNVGNTGIALEISHVGFGSVGWNPGKLNPNILKPAGPIDPQVPVGFISMVVTC